MPPQPTTTSLRKVRTFEDDMRRAEGGVPTGMAPLTTATSVVAPTINVRSSGPVSETLKQAEHASAQKPRGMSAVLSHDLMDIRNVAEGTEEATIVSERKARKWSFTAAVKESLGSWWKDTLAEIKEETGERPQSLKRALSSGTQNRIVKAAQIDFKKTTPATDTKALLKSQPQAIAPEAQTSAVPQEPTSPQGWTHVTDASPAPLPTREPIPKVARPVVRPLPVTVDAEPPLTRGVERLPTPAPESFRTSSAPATGSPVREERAWALGDTALSPESNALDQTLASREAAIREESAKFAARAREAAQRRKEYEASQHTSSGSKYFVYGTLGVITLSLITLLGVGGYALFTREGPIAPAPEPGIPLLFKVSESVGIPLITERTDFMLDLTTRVIEATGAQGTFVRYYFYYQSDRSETELPAQAFLDVLDLRAPGSLLRTIDPVMMFGAYVSNPNAPFIVFKVRNFEEALGGMLLFEPNMNSDFAPLMGPNLGRVGQVGQFRDEVVSGIDTRSLYDDFGNRVMMYAFIDRETLVITTSPAALVALSQVLK